jgi:hypothetical protein
VAFTTQLTLRGFQKKSFTGGMGVMAAQALTLGEGIVND